MDKLRAFKEKNFETLDMYMPIVERVHGPHHKEIFDVAKTYETIKEKLNADDSHLDQEFAQLKEITDNYTVPDDVCETYAGIYKTLEAFNKIYEEK